MYGSEDILNSRLAVLGALAHHLHRRTACKIQKEYTFVPLNVLHGGRQNTFGVHNIKTLYTVKFLFCSVTHLIVKLYELGHFVQVPSKQSNSGKFRLNPVDTGF